MSRKLVEVTKQDGTTYHDTFEGATETSKTTLHRWEGTRKLVLGSKDCGKVSWAPRQSGLNGPLVLQVVTR